MWDSFVKYKLTTLEEDEDDLDIENPFLYWLEREVWEDMARIVFHELHNAYSTELKYLTGWRHPETIQGRFHEL
jgi:hypothetical protein